MNTKEQNIENFKNEINNLICLKCYKKLDSIIYNNKYVKSLNDIDLNNLLFTQINYIDLSHRACNYIVNLSFNSNLLITYFGITYFFIKKKNLLMLESLE